MDGGWDKLFGMAVSVNPDGHRVLCVSRRKKEVLKKSEEKARRPRISRARDVYYTFTYTIVTIFFKSELI